MDPFWTCSAWSTTPTSESLSSAEELLSTIFDGFDSQPTYFYAICDYSTTPDFRRRRRTDAPKVLLARPRQSFHNDA
ncbi:uncharacterized protein STEHIDRAFT_122385 [Stereum hirsutum FP-91666 SS1]|uniref:uncharacterized protein n=1 Tax=Stereum hirsutum (strain FP-91666) TaxID=721885 RepID=UPI000444A678|nr:uncharacterized protein STEHIDRAFT_122385 [Stereum hirsutum FP-91666 SS1]EIM85472.1 hypothetical protein STEHIDRAFT_122385 [Stereum hirsutum FP-91666 SS1]